MKKMLSSLILLVMCISLSGCYKQEKFNFQEGRYAYNGKQINFYEDTVISNVYLDLQLLKDPSKNIITNRKNHLNYNVEFIIVTGDGQSYLCDFVIVGKLGKVGDQVDRYYVNVDVSKILNEDNAMLYLVLEFKNPNYYKDSSLTDATEVSIQVKNLVIENEFVDPGLYDFPNKLYYVGEIKTLNDGCYLGIEIATLSNKIEDFYHIPLEIKDEKLYDRLHDENYYNEPVLIDLEEELFDCTKLNILEEYENIVNKINLERKVFYLGENLSFYNKTSTYIVLCDESLYLIKINKKIDTNEIIGLDIYFLNNKLVELWFISEDGGCMVDEVIKHAQKNSNYTIDFSKHIFFTDTFINLKTLKIYDKVIKADEHMKLVPYDEQEGIFYMYIIEYVLKNGNFHFNSQYVSEEELMKYENVETDGNKIIVEIDNIKYTLYNEFSRYLISDIEMASSIFGSYENDDKVLSILFGSNNLDYNKSNISVTKKDSGYVLKLGHPPVTG